MFLQLKWQLTTESIGKEQIFFQCHFNVPLYQSTRAAECTHESRGGFEGTQATCAISSEVIWTQTQTLILSSPLLCRAGPAAEQRADGASVASWDVQIPISGMPGWF